MLTTYLKKTSEEVQRLRTEGVLVEKEILSHVQATPKPHLSIYPYRTLVAGT